ncbi:DUF5677 domain-containing protein [Streptococcus uberis]|uniref:DUF5677 domain-containing protein n=1 Tax=Streptococcus uberis TaxID=1349 RepID=UPI001FF138BA|nr:DUF5677 domain-containing protein [Streptococcus uberis]MCK1190718.1 DUF5677 domain-containing protein [Streptococcus uberis]MCK1208777.1 DUF5677 domain-containing protein [Streptococcus uberis]
MSDKFEQFFTDTLNEILEDHAKTLNTQVELDDFIEKYENADFSALFKTMIDDTSKQMVSDSKKVMHENSLFFRNEEAEILARINQKWSNAFVTSEAMYMMVLEAVKDYSNFVSELENKERVKSIKKYTALKYIHGRGLQQFLEIITLMKSGFADGAYARWRSLYELNIIASFISKYGEKVAESYILSQNTENRYEWARACGEFNSKKEYIRFDDIRKKANFPSNLWQHQYQLANEVVHPSSQGTFNRLGTMSNEDTISVGHTDFGLTTPGEHSAITLAQLTGLLLTVYPSGDALLAANMINKWVDVVREYYFKSHDYIFPGEPKLWDEEE